MHTDQCSMPASCTNAHKVLRNCVVTLTLQHMASSGTPRLSVQTLVCCTRAHLPGSEGVGETLGPQEKAVKLQLQKAAQLLLPQLLATYEGTICKEDCACLLAMRALDSVLIEASQLENGQNSFIEHVGSLWGGFWQAASSCQSSSEHFLDDLLHCPDLVDPRCLSVLRSDDHCCAQTITARAYKLPSSAYSIAA
jgi:hypothetical protein